MAAAFRRLLLGFRDFFARLPSSVPSGGSSVAESEFTGMTSMKTSPSVLFSLRESVLLNENHPPNRC
jgi:hypothetical protein